MNLFDSPGYGYDYFYPQELPGCPEVTLSSFVEIFRGVTDAAIPSGSLLA